MPARSAVFRLAVGLFLFAYGPTGARADEPAEQAEPTAVPTEPAASEAAGEEAEGLGIGVELGLGSLYYFRGANLFQGPVEPQGVQHLFTSATLSWSRGPFTIGYFTAFQLTGDVRARMDDGSGAEQDLFAAFEFPAGPFTGTVGANAYTYPFGTRAGTGVDFLAYADPFLALAWAGLVDAKLQVFWYRPLPAAAADQGYVYFNPMVGKGFELSGAISLQFAGCMGYKLATGNFGDDQVWDAMAGAKLAWKVGDFTLAPGVNAGWSNLVGKSFADGLMFWGSLTAGWEG